jgi:hypothetical protein
MARCILQPPAPIRAGLGRRQTHKFSCSWIWFPAHRTPRLCMTTRKAKTVTRWLSATGEEISSISIFSLSTGYSLGSPDWFIASFIDPWYKLFLDHSVSLYFSSCLYYCGLIGCRRYPLLNNLSDDCYAFLQWLRGDRQPLTYKFRFTTPAEIKGFTSYSKSVRHGGSGCHTTATVWLSLSPT